MFFYSDDPVRDAERHDAHRNAYMRSRPVCSICKEPIQDDHYYHRKGEDICPFCLEEHCRMTIEDDY